MQVYTAGIETNVKVWDLRKEAVVLTLEGHSDIVTGMSVSPDGSHLLTNSMDNTLRVWDVRPYAPENRCTKVRDCLNRLDVTALVTNVSRSSPSGVWTHPFMSTGECIVWHRCVLQSELYILCAADYVAGCFCEVFSDLLPWFGARQVLAGHQHNFEKNLLKCGWSPDASQVCSYSLASSYQSTS